MKLNCGNSFVIDELEELLKGEWKNEQL
jgi:hypothetical protein